MKIIEAEKLTFRFEITDADIDVIRDIVKRAGVFNPEEIGVAVELVTERLDKGDASGYHFAIAESGGKALGYVCYGPIPLTKARFDIYWIAVNPEARGMGIGASLLNTAESHIARSGGEYIFIDTSSRIDYLPARNLYMRTGYREAACVKHFYSSGDNKIIFVKKIIPR